ncbi:MAG: DUF1788 domain-containing protein [Candidatus Tenebribacter davisii]|nr:DUF1788 domain-containing protein [Candidatus Tenebribacter davisii]
MLNKHMTPRQASDKLPTIIASERFLKMQGLGKEVPFFICPYLPEDAIEMQKVIGQLIKKLNQQGVKVLEINLYDLSLEILKKRNLYDRIMQKEQFFTKDKLTELLQSVLDTEAHLIPAIAEKMQQSDFDVMFITGVGEVFPYIRSHNVLNNLQSTAKDKPTVMFFPGAYCHSLDKGASLDLFGRLHDDKYYRAFNLCQYEI